MTAALLSVFGPEAIKGIGSLVKGFDFTKIDVTDRTKNDFLHVGLAPSYGTLTSESVKHLDDKLKIMITATMRALEAQRKLGELSWDTVMSALIQNPLLDPSDERVDRADKLVKSGVNAFKFDGSPDANIVREVNNWFQKLIADDNIVKDTKIDIKVLADIVAQTGATVDSFETVFFKEEKHEKTLVDIGVLRFPDIDHPHFQVYRIKLTAWSSSTRVLMVEDNQNGITGEFNACKFLPRASVIEGLKAETKKKAIEEAESFLA